MERKARTIVRETDAGTDLIAWLASRFTYANAERWTEYCENGELLVNGRCAGPGYRLELGDAVSFEPAGFVEPQARLDYKVIHEDEDYLVLDKPAHLVCHPGGRFFSHSLWALLRDSGRGWLHFASRLDRETSGVLALCKSPEAARRWEAARSAGLVEKTYYAVIHGDFTASLEAAGFLVPDRASAIAKKRKFIPAEGASEEEIREGEPCSTFLRLLGRGRGLCAVEAIPKTGRTHQIRATLHSLGYPVLGDKLYGLDELCFIRFAEGRLTEADRKKLAIDRQALHSAVLRFPGAGGHTLECRSEPPPELRVPVSG